MRNKRWRFGSKKRNFYYDWGGPEAFKIIEPVINDISVESGYFCTGEVGSGRFLKMIHNGIEYGMMQAMAEGFDILEKSEYDYDLEGVAKV